jgi:hypothetical protein
VWQQAYSVDERGKLNVIWKNPGLTLAAGAFFAGLHVVIVSTNQIILIDASECCRSVSGDQYISTSTRDCLALGGRQLQSVAVSETNSEKDVVFAHVLDPYVLVQRRDGSCLIYGGNAHGELLAEPLYSVSVTLAYCD